jgi:FdhE protein
MADIGVRVDPWERRVRRAGELAERWPFAAEVVEFCTAMTRFQREVYLAVDSDVAGLLPWVDPFLDRVEEAGPEALARAAHSLRGADWERLLRAAWERGAGGEEPLPRLFPRALLHPCAVRRAEAGAAESPPAPNGSCPFCRHAPAVGLLREDREAGAVVRSLVCSLCALEWSFPRVLCPGCGEERPERLPRYTAEEIPWVRIEACESCGRYLKSIDLTKEPQADPFADEVGSTPLDMVARERGFAKFEPNLAGI